MEFLIIMLNSSFVWSLHLCKWLRVKALTVNCAGKITYNYKENKLDNDGGTRVTEFWPKPIWFFLHMYPIHGIHCKRNFVGVLLQLFGGVNPLGNRSNSCSIWQFNIQCVEMINVSITTWRQLFTCLLVLLLFLYSLAVSNWWCQDLQMLQSPAQFSSGSSSLFFS